MVLESLIGPEYAERRPWVLFFFGIIFTSISVSLSLIIFRKYASLILVFFIVMACMPLVYRILRYEVKKDERYSNQLTLLKEHGKALEVFLFLFLGITVACTLWYVFLPPDIVSDLFYTQSETIAQINQATGKVTYVDHFFGIFLNNIRVMLFCIVFSFLYGLGALFILTWNASVIGVAMGDLMRSSLARLASATGANGIHHYFSAFLIGFMRYFPHGVLEIGAYFIAGIAGSIISHGIIRHNFGTKRFETIIFDATELLLIALAVLLIAGIVEVYITPHLFALGMVAYVMIALISIFFFGTVHMILNNKPGKFLSIK